ncbi:acyl-CoA synthetase [Parafrankia colletiae]|uniref:Acyl-CoA synthetase n=1 Tax=Parafrankia colletiae TaxID=573497 RepID=A0A1S1R002_9ACTN|nr:AMP-binding protein [Parafrankia colletiae]MCK9900236.1 AMP-binding protein [Frankia sp. Cpl3]OHV40278.1 acyl-CoA synthetase [Parafrankia colletiae]
MTTQEWSLPAVLDVVTDVAPDRDMLVSATTRRSYAQVRDRTRHLAAHFRQHGLGVRRERRELRRWECGQSPVALVMSNCPEYLETMIGAFRARAVPFNVNHHYAPREIGALLSQVGAEAVVYHRRLGPKIAQGARLDDRLDGDLSGLLLIDVDDGSGVAPLPGSTSFVAAVADAEGVHDLPMPSPDDLYLVCTGGTTGTPKGVLWRQGDVYVSATGGVEGATRDVIAEIAEAGAGVWFAAPPLMHGASQWTAFAGLVNGGTVVLHDDSRPFDAREILRTVERERVTMMSIVGDAYARPLVDEISAGSYDLTSLVRLGTGGATTSTGLKQALLDLLPQLTVVDGYGASETGGMAFGTSTSGRPAHRFRLSAGAAVLSADRSRFLDPRDDEVGWTARVGRIPLGYLGDRVRTEQTFPLVDGRRTSVPGDRAHYNSDGDIIVLGRDAMVVNTGGEKVFVEEVEEVLRQHPDILDALVVGRPNDRYGEEVVALVQLRAGAQLSPAAVREHVAGQVARFKAPRAVLLCPRIGRHATGKADYIWARRAALAAVSATVPTT